MRILITNDDGIHAPGLKVLHEIATTIAGKDGEVWTVAPAFEQSGVGHCISYTHPTLLAKISDKKFSAEGTPADCVLAGLYEVMADTPPDLILSGVNRGNNSAENTLYSGTIGAAIEGALQGVKSIALSQYYGPKNRDLDDQFEAARLHGAATVQSLLDHGSWGGTDYSLFYNVNFPPTAAKDVKGTQVVAQGRRKGINFRAKQETSPTGRSFLWVHGGAQDVPSGADTDATANLDGYISVTPMRADLTCHDTLTQLKKSFP